MGYEKYYPGGWQSGEAGGTPITPEALNHMEAGIENAVPTSRTVNGKELTEDITLSASDVGAAASSHNQSASTITSGTLGVARGGTGKATHTSNAVLTGNGTSAVNNVATASGALYATAANGAAKFGTLPLAQGGTGTTGATRATASNTHFNAIFTKFGNLITCSLYPKVSTDTMIYESTITIPSGYRIKSSYIEVQIYSYKNKNNGGDGVVRVHINSNGNLILTHGNGFTVGEMCNTYCWLTT